VPQTRTQVVASFALPLESLRGVRATFEIPWEAEGVAALTLAVVLAANGITVPPARPDPGYHVPPHEGEVLAPTMTLVALLVAARLIAEAWSAAKRQTPR
jgi:hypothetical protein